MSTEKSKNVVVTKKARENLVKARAGAITLPKIIGMAFGEGGVSSSGTVIAPTESQSKLNKELFRKAIVGRCPLFPRQYFPRCRAGNTDS